MADTDPAAPAPHADLAADGNGIGHHDILGPGHTFATVTDKVASIVLTKRVGKKWIIGFAIAFALANLLFVTIANLLFTGVGIWGINAPVGWGFDIINFVWWIGIGHAGTLISAILLLLRQKWRTSINRFAEAMTLFAVACAGLYPLLHMGRPWFFYWLLPYPNTMQLWPQWRSPLVWDVFAVTTYATTSALFWYVGLIPDLATLRDRSQSRIGRIVYGFLAMGWRNSALHWHRYEVCYMLLAGLATPLVISVHTVVSFDFAAGIVPGWHATIFPPYFVAGAIYAGFAMVLLLTIPLRAVYGVDDFITDKHLDNMAKILLATGLMVVYGYFVEIFMGWYSGEHAELFLVENRLNGFNSVAYYSLLLCNAVAPQVLWFRWARRSPATLWVVSLIVSVGMWLERFVIIVGSLRLDYVPSMWGNYQGTAWDWSMFLGTIGLFFSLLFLFLRLLPMISIFEMRTLLPGADMPPHAADEAHQPEAAHMKHPVYGVVAEFKTPTDLVAAARTTREAGYVHFEGYSPYPIEELSEAIGYGKSRLPLLVFLGGLAGCVGGYFLQWYTSVHYYPLNIGGRPLHSWPSFIPVTFECTILGAVLTAVFGMLALNGLPMPYHPLFHVKRFADRASRDLFFLCINHRDPKFDRADTAAFLHDLSPSDVQEVPH